MEERIICRVLTGPTCSGKTEMSLRLAEKHGWEIACMDSMQIYRGMDIGTAKPTAEERRRVPHHLLDICDPQDPFSVALYRDLAESLVREKKKNSGKDILFVGGTGLYLKAMVYPMEMGSVPADETLRRELNTLAEQPGGKEKIHRILQKLDPDTAKRLPLNDIRRSIRAIEVSRHTGIPFSRQPERKIRSPFEWRIVSTEVPRANLYDRINRRVHQMMKAGLADEVRQLLEMGIPENAQSMQGLGYKETVLYLKGIRTLEETVEDIQKGTRHYAKRQETFLRRWTEIQTVNSLSEDAMEQAEKVLLGG